MFAEMAEAKFFRILDTEGGFWQPPLNTSEFAFKSPFCRCCFLGLPFGIHLAYCRKTSQTLKGVPGVEIHVNDTREMGSTAFEHQE